MTVRIKDIDELEPALNGHEVYSDPVLSIDMNGCHISHLEPDIYIGLLLAHGNGRCSVRRLRAMFLGTTLTKAYALPRLVPGTLTSVVIPLPGSLELLFVHDVIGGGMKTEEVISPNPKDNVILL